MAHRYPMSSRWLIGLAGDQVTAQEAEVLCHPLVGGVVLFQENYQSCEQICALIAQIKAVSSDLWISVDQEGGRVTRFVGEDYGDPLLSLADIGSLYAKDRVQGLQLAVQMGQLNGKQLKSVGVDMLLGPVLDLYRGGSVLAQRCFSDDPAVVIPLARAYIEGLAQAGVGAVAKHFPGHGVVTEDTHTEVAHSDVSLHALQQADLLPYQALLSVCSGVMCGHVVYTQIDKQPASFSPFWMQKILRDTLGFKGMIVSDCLSMRAAQPEQCIDNLYTVSQAGCDWIICTHMTQYGYNYTNLLDHFTVEPNVALDTRLSALRERMVQVEDMVE